MKPSLEKIITPLVLSSSMLVLGVNIQWDSNPEPDLAGYRLHYWTEGKSKSIIDLPGKPSSPEYNLTGLEKGITYSIYITAYNTKGEESPPSTLLTYNSRERRKISPPTNLRVIGN